MKDERGSIQPERRKDAKGKWFFTGWWTVDIPELRSIDGVSITHPRFRGRFPDERKARMFMDHCSEFHQKPNWANVRAFGQEPDWAHTADLEELKLNIEKLSDDLRVAEERIRKLEEELSLMRRDIAALRPPEATELPEDIELKEWEALRDTFKAADQAAQPKGGERRRTERLYRVHPSWPPLMLAEHCKWRRNSNPRSPDELAAGEELLRDLNFQTEVSDNVVTYKLCHERFIVLADPRGEGWLRFCVYEETTHSGERRSKRRTFRTERFSVSDLRSELGRDEFRRRLSQACRVLVARAEAARNPGRH
jgi:hypothetical protein